MADLCEKNKDEVKLSTLESRKEMARAYEEIQGIGVADGGYSSLCRISSPACLQCYRRTTVSDFPQLVMFTMLRFNSIVSLHSSFC